MPSNHLSDAEGKAILRTWPSRVKKLWGTPPSGGWWLRGQPKLVTTTAAGPTLNNAGANTSATVPDGLWVYLTAEFADIVCVEVCTSTQNLNDKRSRYGLFQQALMLTCSHGWLTEQIGVQSGGRRARWQATGSIAVAPTSDLVLPVRFLRVLYTIPNDIYVTWKPNNVPGPHEFFCPHSSFGSYNSQMMQRFLKRMSPKVHFYR